MIIKAKNFAGKLDLSTREGLQEDNFFEKEPLRLTISAGQSIEVDDKYYTINNIQSALKAGYIEILDYDQQNVFAQEIKVPESTTTNYHFTKVEILNRADYPQDAFEKYNANMDSIDAQIASAAGTVWGGITGTLSNQTDLNLALGGKVPTSTTVNGYPLSSNITLSKSDIGLGNVADVDTTTTANITDSTDKRFVSDTDITNLGNLSGENTGDQDLSGLVPYTGATGDVNLGANDITAGNLTGENTGDQDLSGLVPYTGATGDVNLGTHDIETSGTGTFGDTKELNAGTITRGVDGLVSSVAITGKRTLSFTRNTYGYVTSVTDGTNTWTYTRDVNNNLTAWSYA